MKMAKSNKRLLAVLLSVLMIVSIIPAAALAVNAADYGTITSGQSVTVNYNAGYSYTTETSVPIYDSTTQSTVNKYYAQLVINGIDNVYACDYDLGEYPAGVVASTSVSVTPKTAATYTTANLKTVMNAALKAKGTYFEVPTFTASAKDSLTGVTARYSGSETYKTVYLYAKVTPYTYNFNTGLSAPGASAGQSTYVRLGTLTMYSAQRNVFDLKLSSTANSIACGQSIAVIANVAGASNVKYAAYTESAAGIAAINQTQPGVFIITANELVTRSNKVTIYAYQMDASGTNYVYRSTTGAEIYESTFNAKGITVGNVKYSPIYDYASLTFSTSSPITAIYLTPNAASCEVGDTVALKTTVIPTGATGDVTYTSSNTAVATVSSNGLVTAKGVGTATIFAAAGDGSGISAYCVIRVKAATARLTLNKSAMNLEVGKSDILTATLTPANLASKTIIWTSSDATVASVSGGVVTGKKVGVATITATYYTADGMTKTASCVVNVKAKTVAITADKALTVAAGKTAKINASVVNATNKGLLFVSDTPSVAKVDENGVVTGVKAGSAMITIVSVEDSSVKTYCVVTVKKATQTVGIIDREATYKKGSKYYWTDGVTSAEVKDAIAELKGEDEINVIVDVTSESNSNKTILSRYAITRLAKYADSLTVKVGEKTFTFDSLDLTKMANGYPVYVYTVDSKVSVQYKNDEGEFVKFTGLTVEKN